MTKIEWTERTWNPVTGCTKVSPGCKNCYAERMAKRLAGRAGYPKDEPFRVTLHPDRLTEPFKWRKPCTVFVCSMSDLFHKDVPRPFVAKVRSVMDQCPRHTFQLLTKRPENIPREFWSPNVWLGTSIENTATVYRKLILADLAGYANVLFLSCEPLLGPLPNLDLERIKWVIVGGESGPGARHMDLDWARGIRDKCREHGVPFFMKQLSQADTKAYKDFNSFPADLQIREYPKP